MIVFSEDFGDRLDLQGEEDGPKLDAKIRDAAPDALVVFNLHGVKYLGYSYSKPTIRKALERRNRGEYGGRRLVVISELDDQFLEGLSAALRERKLIMYAAPSSEAIGREGKLIGRESDVLSETFKALLRKAPVTTGTLSQYLNTSPQNVKNRIDRLEKMGIVEREKIKSETGGYEWLNRIV